MVAIHAPIVAVTVYTGNARITRRAVIHLDADEHTLILDGLPASLDDESVRASGRGANVRLVGVDVVTRFVTEAPEANVAELMRQLEALQDELKVLADADAVLADRAQFIGGLREHASADLPRALAWGKTTLDNVSALAEFMARELANVHQQQQANALKRRGLEREIEAVKLRLGQVQQVRPAERRQIQVGVEVAAETDFELDVVYAISGASWAPIYDLRLEEGKVALAYLAQVTQQTGEDWRDVQLALSTARPATTRTIPELSPWYVDLFQPIPVQRAKTQADTLGAGLPAPAPQAARMAFAEAAPAEYVMAEVDSSGAAVTYRVARPADIPADGTPHKVTVAALDLQAKLDYVIAPKLAEEAYLRATIKNDTPYQLLAGAASIYHGADFVGVTRLDAVAPSEEFETQLGVDDRVKVERELTERAAAKTPILIGNQRRTTWGYRIRVTNHCPAPIRARVLDQIPVARNEEIKIKLQEATPKPAEQSELGELAWELELQPGVRQEIAFTFVVEHPRERRLTGIN